MSTFSTWATGLPTTGGALAPPGYPWRNRIHLTAQGTRVIVYNDGTNLRSVASTGTTGVAPNVQLTWGAPVTLTALTAVATQFSAMSWLDSCFVSGAGAGLYVVAANPAKNAVLLFWVPYNNDGTWGTVHSMTLLTLGSGTLLGVRCVYDGAATTIDSHHTPTATGLIHVLLDQGSTISLAAVDPNNSTGSPLLVLLSPSFSTGLVGPWGAGNLIPRSPNHLYFLAPGLENYTPWVGAEILWTPGSAGLSTYTGPSTYSSAMSNAWLNAETATPSAGSTYTLTPAAGTAGSLPATYAPTSYPVLGTGFDLGLGAAGGFFPAGPWTVTLDLSQTGTATLAAALSVRVYELTATGGYTLIGTIGPGSATPIPGTLSATGKLPGYTMGINSRLYVEVDAQITSASGVSGTYTVTKGTLTLSVFFPPVLSSTAAPTPDAYTLGPLETPTLVPPDSRGAGYGVALTLGSDAGLNPTPGLNLFLADDHGLIRICNRTPAAQYVNNMTVPGSPTLDLGWGVTAALDPTTGSVCVLGKFANHLQSIRFTSGVWGASGQWDQSGVNVVEFCGLVRDGLHRAGNAAAYIGSDGHGYYDDQGALNGVGVPTITNLQLIPTPGAASADVLGTTAPYTAMTTSPWVQFLYNEALAGDTLGSYRLKVYNVTAGGALGTLLYDTGRQPGPDKYPPGWMVPASSVNIGNVVLPGGIAQLQIPAAAGLIKGNPYAVHLIVWDHVGGQASAETPSDASVFFAAFDPPTVWGVGHHLITDVNTVFAVLVSQPQNVGFGSDAFSLYDLTLATQLYSQVETPSAVIQPATLTAGIIAGQTTFTASGPIIPSGTFVWFDPYFAAGEFKQISGAPTGTGPYTYTVPAFAHSHANASPVWAEYITPSIYLKNILQNGHTVFARHTLTGYPVINGVTYPPLTGVTSYPMQASLPVPPWPTGVSATWNPGTPVSGGVVTVRWTQASGSPVPAACTIYQRLSSTLSPNPNPWVAVKTVTPPVIGANAFDLHTVANGVAYDFAVTSVSPEGLESPQILGGTVTPVFTYGLWLSDAAIPTDCVELGIWNPTGQTATQLPEWQPVQDKEVASMFNRQLPVVTVGSTYYYKLAQQAAFILPSGYETQIRALLAKWDRLGSTLLVRDAYGLMFHGMLAGVNLTADTIPLYQAVKLDLVQVDPGIYAIFGV